MALIGFTGFEDQDNNMVPTFFTSATSVTYLDYSTATRFGTGRCFYSTYAGTVLRKYLSNSIVYPNKLILGFAAKMTATTSAALEIIIGNSSTYAQSTIVVGRTSRKITLFRGNAGGTLLDESPVNLFNPEKWCYYEIKLNLSNTLGAIDIRVNGQTILSMTNQDLMWSGTDESINSIFFEVQYTYFDDVYICDDTGSQNNDFLGDVVVDGLTVTANGTTNNGTASAGSNYECVDEIPYNDDTDYVTLDAVDEIELYTISNLPSTSYTKTIYGLKLTNRIKRLSTGFREVDAVLRTNSINYVSSDELALQTEYTTFDRFWELNPNDSAAWEEADINALESGIKITA